MKKTLKKISLFTGIILCANGIMNAQNVGIGTTSPSEKLEVIGNIKLSDTLKTTKVIVGTGSATYPLTVRATSNSQAKGFGQISQNGTIAVGTYVDDIAGAFIQTHTNHDLNFTTNSGAAKMVIKSGTGNVGIGMGNGAVNNKLEVNGNVTIHNQLQILGGSPGTGKILTSNPNGYGSWEYPSQYNTGFATYPNTISTITSGSSNQVIPFVKTTPSSSFNFDDGNDFSNTTYSYTVPQSGVYVFHAHVGMNAIYTAASNGIVVLRFMRNGIPSVSQYVPVAASTPMQPTIAVSATLKLSMGDQISVAIYNSSGASFNLTAASCEFSGHRVY